MTENKTYTTLEELTEKANNEYLQYLKDNKLTDILRAIGLFPDQTITNDVLILSQNPNAICVKRMKEWNYYHRSVKKSEKAIKVISHHIDKSDRAYTDENGNVYTQGVEKLKTDVGYVFDISQTEGKEYEYLNSNKETIAKHFEAAKKALENTARGYTFVYQDQDENSKIDWQNKVVYIKDGLSIDDLINSLIKDVSQILLSTRRDEGLQNVSDFENNCVIYAVNSKLGLELPNLSFDVNNLNETGMQELKGNLQKVRSVTKQLLSNFESTIEHSVRNLDKKIEQQEPKTPKIETIEEKTQEKPKKTRAKVKKAESEVQNA